MKNYFFILFSVFGTEVSYSQSILNFNLGVGRTLDHLSNVTPTFALGYQYPLSRHIAIGGVVMYERYSFDYNANDLNFPIIVKHKSNFLLTGLKIDVALNKNSDIVHFFTLCAAGVLTEGGEYIYNETGYNMNMAISNNSHNISKYIYRTSVGLQENIKLNSKWGLSLIQEFSFLANKLSTFEDSYLNYDHKQIYISFKVGFTHKYSKIKIAKNEPNGS